MTFVIDYFFRHEQGSRLCGIWADPWPSDQAGAEFVARFDFVDLGDGQDGRVESDFLAHHLPWAVGGLHGVDAGGRPWAIVAQVIPESARQSVGAVDANTVMDLGIVRALSFNDDASWRDCAPLTRHELLEIYDDSGVDCGLVGDWPMADLVSGLIAGCTYVPLSEIVRGRAAGCLLPGAEHECQGDVFRDAFAQWAAGLADVPPEEDWGGEPDDEDDGEHDARSAPAARGRYSRKRVAKWSTQRLRLEAVDAGWTVKRARKARRWELRAFLGGA